MLQLPRMRPSQGFICSSRARFLLAVPPPFAKVCLRCTCVRTSLLIPSPCSRQDVCELLPAHCTAAVQALREVVRCAAPQRLPARLPSAGQPRRLLHFPILPSSRRHHHTAAQVRKLHIPLPACGTTTTTCAVLPFPPSKKSCVAALLFPPLALPAHHPLCGVVAVLAV